MTVPEIIIFLDAHDTSNWSNVQGDRSEDQHDAFASIITLLKNKEATSMDRRRA